MVPEMTSNGMETRTEAIRCKSASESIAEYVEKYQLDLTRLCISLCKNNADAEDLFSGNMAQGNPFLQQIR